MVPVRMILASSTAAIWPPPAPDAGCGFAGGAPTAPPLSPLPALSPVSPPAWAAGAADDAALPHAAISTAITIKNRNGRMVRMLDLRSTSRPGWPGRHPPDADQWCAVPESSWGVIVGPWH